jgi:hypothetical protein
MPRSRLLKPGFFKNEHLAQLSPHARLCFAGLWTLADREGRLEDRPLRLKAEIFPYENLDMDELLTCLADNGFIVRYRIAAEPFLSIPKFLTHQSPHVREADSTIPAPDTTETSTVLAPVEASPRSPVSVPVPVLVLDPVLVPKTVPIPKTVLKAAPTAPAPALPVENVRIITKIAHEVIGKHNGHKVSGSDLCDEIKTLCAKRKISYDATVVRKALDSAEVQRAQKGTARV